MRQKIKEALEAKRAEAQQAWEEFDKTRTSMVESGLDPLKDKDAFEKAHELHKVYATKNAEADELKEAYDKAVEMEEAVEPKRSPFGGKEGEGKNGEGQLVMDELGQIVVANGKALKTPGEIFTESREIKALQESGVLDMERAPIHSGPVKVLDRDQVKTLLTGGGAPGTQILRPLRLPGILPFLQAPLQIVGRLTVGATDNNVIEWVRESAVANNAAEVAEATATTGTSGTKPESGMTFVVESTTCQTIAHWIPATKQSLQDMPQLRTLVDSMLTDGVARRLNTQVLSGNGTAPNLKGILNYTILTQSFTTDMFESLLRGITAVRLAFFEPSMVLMNPADFISMRLLKMTTGEYYFGPPSQTGVQTVWGVPIMTDPLQPAGFATVGKWDEAILYVRDGVNVLATDSHSDFFVRNLVVILAEGRYGLAVPRPQAFCNVDIVTP